MLASFEKSRLALAAFVLLIAGSGCGNCSGDQSPSGGSSTGTTTAPATSGSSPGQRVIRPGRLRELGLQIAADGGATDASTD